METYFLKAYVGDSYIGVKGKHSLIEHFGRENQNIEELIYIIQKATKSIEEWTISVRLSNLKSPFTYGLSKQDISRMDFDNQIEVLEYWCNAYTLLYHLTKKTENKLDDNYREEIDKSLLLQEGGDIIEYCTKANRRISDKWGRKLF